jgi:Ni,Fe-hydrogenase III large subunit/NADH:ubiquinone oxidoreductase subunit C
MTAAERGPMTPPAPASDMGRRDLDALRAVLPTGTLDSRADTVTVPVRPAELERAVHRLAATPGCRLADLFATDGGQVRLHLVWALDSLRRYLILTAPVRRSGYPALSEIAPAAFHEECEIYEQFGVRPAGGKPLNRVALPPHAGEDFPRLGHPPARPPGEVHAPHHVGGQAFEFPFGPVRAVGAESLYYGLVTSGEEVVDLYMFTWHKHRGAEWRLRGRTPAEALFQVERLEGLSAVGNAWAFADAVESALGVRVPDAVARTRAVALELERLYNHAAALAALCQATGLSVGQAAAEITLERLLRLNAAVFGHRYLFGVIAIGGVHRPPDAAALHHELPAVYEELHRTADALMGTNSFLDRLEATGVVTSEEARQLGLVGPVARASGLAADCRRDHPAPPYDRHPAATTARHGGDCLARLKVMLAEAADSVRLITAFLTAGTGNGRENLPAGGGQGLGPAESSRGESLAWVSLDADGRLERVRLRPASARNWRAFDDAARSQNVFTDIPIIEAGFWLTVAGTAR